MLFWTIKTQYEITLREITRISPRFSIMLVAMVLSIVFIVLDICSVTGAIHTGAKGTVGINPFWKFAFVFKCLTDAVVLDDFKMALDRLRAFKISRLGSFSQDTSDRRSRNDRSLVNTWEEVEREAQKRPAMGPMLPSPDGELVKSTNNFSGFKAPRKPKDSVVSPDGIHRDSFSSSSLGPEDMVPSALTGLPPIRTMELAHAVDRTVGERRASERRASERRASERRASEKRQVEFIDDVDAIQNAHLDAECDYANALRDLEGCSPSTSPAKTTFSRRSLPP
jgi:hypothetical protein